MILQTIVSYTKCYRLVFLKGKSVDKKRYKTRKIKFKVSITY